jgi:hypothetical protein
MKDTFPGYHKKGDKEIKAIWKNGLIFFDTNVLLNLYRYSDETRTTLLELIKKFNKQIYLPHQAALEYNRNRYEVISDQEKEYKEFIKQISRIKEDLQSTSKPPFLTEKVHKSLISSFDLVNKEVEESIKKYCDYLKEDPIYNILTELFDEKITPSFNDEELEAIYKEGESRYLKKTPPGYEDEKNKEDERKYGDLILWKQIIRTAKKEKKSIILVTDERKTDWWWKIKDGRNMGPRQELVQELYNEAGVDFHMYSSERFLRYGQNYLEEHVNEKALNEIKAMKLAEIRHLQRLKEEEMKFRDFGNKYNEELRFLLDRSRELTQNISEIKREKESLLGDDEENIEVQEYLDHQNAVMHKFMHERHMLRSKIEGIRTNEEALSEKERMNREYFRKKNFGNNEGEK